MNNTEKQQWAPPTVTDFDIAEHTRNIPGDGPDGASMDPEGGGGPGS